MSDRSAADFKLVIFDCDGVLVDSEIISNEVDAKAFTALGYPITTEEFIRRFTGRPIKETFQEIEAEMGTPLPDDLLERVNAEIAERYETELIAIPGVAELIDGLDLPSCIASSTYMEKLRWSLDLTDLLKRFDPHIFSASQVTRGKPAPDLFLFAADQMGTAPRDCLVIEDSVAGVTAGVAAGMPVIGFTGGSHTYRGHADRLMEAGAYVVFDRMSDMAFALSNG